MSHFSTTNLYGDTLLKMLPQYTRQSPILFPLMQETFSWASCTYPLEATTLLNTVWAIQTFLAVLFILVNFNCVKCATWINLTCLTSVWKPLISYLELLILLWLHTWLQIAPAGLIVCSLIIIRWYFVQMSNSFGIIWNFIWNRG